MHMRTTTGLTIVALLTASPASALDHDDCASAAPLGGTGVFAFDLLDAGASSGPDLESCAPSGPDAWYRWTAPADGVVLVGTCGQTGVDTVIKVYGDECPSGEDQPIACSNDACMHQSQAVFFATAGQEYLIRVAAGWLEPGGTGDFTIRYAELPAHADPGSPLTLECNTPLLVNHGDAITDPERPRLDRLYFNFIKQAGPSNLYLRGLVEPSAYSPNAPNLESVGSVKRYRFTGAAGTQHSFLVETRFEVASVYELYVDCAGSTLAAPPCAQANEHCQPTPAQVGLASNGADFAVAEQVIPSIDGVFNGLCFRGGYADNEQRDCFPLMTDDDFEVNYYADDGGRPGSLLASFSQAEGTLTLDARAATGRYIAARLTEYEYTVSHDDWPAPGGVCTWIEIVNHADGCAWYWTAGGSGERARAWQTEVGVEDVPVDRRMHLCVSTAIERESCQPTAPPPPSPCTLSDALCQAPSLEGVGVLSDRPLAAADDFVPAATGSLGGLCWWGQPGDQFTDFDPSDGFVVAFYHHNTVTGRPGSLAAGPFRTADGTLSVEAAPTGELAHGVLPRYSYSATHAPAGFLGNRRYWVSIHNENAPWRWEFAERGAGNGLAIASEDVRLRNGSRDDLAVCLDAAFSAPPPPSGEPPANDEWQNAEIITLPADITVDTRFATPDAVAAALGAQRWQGLVWYRFNATQPNVRISLQGTEYGRPGALVYRLNAQGTNVQGVQRLDDPASEHLLATTSTAMLVAVGGVTPEGTGAIRLRIEEYGGQLNSPPRPANNHCADAIPIAAPSMTSGTTFGATAAPDYATVDGVRISAPGVWYRVAGTGGNLTASLCNVETDYNARLSVYQDSCETFDAIGVTAADETCGNRPAVSWLSEAGADYLIMVHGARGIAGDFRLDLCDEGVGGADCDGDGIGDSCAIALGVAADLNDNGVPDACECIADVDGSGRVDLQDLLILFARLGQPGGTDEPADVNDDGVVDSEDLLIILGDFGRVCP